MSIDLVRVCVLMDKIPWVFGGRFARTDQLFARGHTPDQRFLSEAYTRELIGWQCDEQLMETIYRLFICLNTAYNLGTTGTF